MIFITCIITGILGLFLDPIAYGTEYWNGEGIANPFALEVFAPFADNWVKIKTFILENVAVTFLPPIAIYRYIRTTPLERKQMRLLLLFMIFPQGVISLLLQLFSVEQMLSVDDMRIVVTFIAFPITIAVGIAFYRLWDIDVIIRRTLIYSVVSALLIMTYFAIVLIAQTFLSGFIPDDNTLLIVGSTLAVAALFNPLQQRVQRVIDRIFYRKRYDANVTLDQFSQKIRDAVDAQAIEQHVLDTVASTIQPETISLWVVEPKNNKS